MHFLKTFAHDSRIVSKRLAPLLRLQGLVPDGLLRYIGEVLEPGLPKDAAVCIEFIRAERGSVKM